MKQDEEDELVRAFREQLEYDKEIEDARIRLANQSDFNLMDGFAMLDAHSKGSITAPELGDALSRLGHHTHKDLIYMLVRRFDKDNDGKLLYSDFCDALTPKSLQH